MKNMNKCQQFEDHTEVSTCLSTISVAFKSYLEIKVQLVLIYFSVPKHYCYLWTAIIHCCKEIDKLRGA